MKKIVQRKEQAQGGCLRRQPSSVQGQGCRLSRQQRGQTLLEFAVVAPLLLFFFLALVDFGIAIDRKLVLDHAVREGARYASVEDDIGLVCDRIVGQAQSLIGPGDLEFSYDDIDLDGISTGAGDSVEVKASYTYTLLLGGMFGLDFNVIDMSPVGAARLELPSSGAISCS